MTVCLLSPLFFCQQSHRQRCLRKSGAVSVVACQSGIEIGAIMVVVKLVFAAGMHDTVFMPIIGVFESESGQGMRCKFCFLYLCLLIKDQRFKQAVQCV